MQEIKYSCSECRDRKHTKKDSVWIPCEKCFWADKISELNRWFDSITSTVMIFNKPNSRLINKDLRILRDSRVAYDLCLYYIRQNKNLRWTIPNDIKQDFDNGEYFNSYSNCHVLLIDIEQHAIEQFDRTLPRILMDLANYRRRLGGLTMWMYSKPFETQIRNYYMAYDKNYDVDKKKLVRTNEWLGFVNYLVKLEQV